MSPVEKLEAAIARLEELKEESTRGPWLVGDANGADPIEYGPLWVIADEAVSLDRVDGEAPETWFMELRAGRLHDVQMVVTLHRTIDTQLVILREDLADCKKNRWIPDRWALALAEAILGGAE